MPGFPKNRERVTGVEPATLCLASTRSGQLSYTRRTRKGLYGLLFLASTLRAERRKQAGGAHVHRRDAFRRNEAMTTNETTDPLAAIRAAYAQYAERGAAEAQELLDYVCDKWRMAPAAL